MADAIKATDVEAVEMVPGVWRRTLAWGERLMVVQVTLEEGAVVPAHRHPHEQITYIVEGELSMQVEGQTHVLRAGDSLLFPSDVEHGATALQHTIVVDTFSPPREDYKL
ncbi:MAG: cupin domain-containing protein [Chloroflexi bacterium]|nr:cupin domain-containing protein [Chloroflexota bacterium]